MARELGAHGIRVNCVMPGSIPTEEDLAAFRDRWEAVHEALSR